MKLLVTGGAGYVGSHCVRELCDHDHQVVVVDNLSAGHREAVDPRAELVVADLAERSRIDDLMTGAKFDAVMHFAGSLNVGESVTEPLLYYRNNVVNSLSLLELMAEHEIGSFVFSSTCAVYGTPPSTPINEDMPTEPINPYGRTKLAIEWALADCVAAWGLSATALRYFNASGAASDGSNGEAHDPEQHLLPLVLQVALGQRERISVFGTDYPTRDGTCVRDYIHVEDLATAHRAAIESQTPATFRAFNVGTGNGVSVRELIDVARAVTGHDIPSVDAPRRPGDPAELYANPERLMSSLGWKPRFGDIREVVETAWGWHQSHPNGFET